MTKEEIRALSVEQVEERLGLILDEIETEGADLDALEEEQRELHERKKELRKAAMVEEEARAKAAEETITIKTFEGEERTMASEEKRNSKAYIEAYAEYMKRDCDLEKMGAEQRTLLTELAEDGTIAVPDFVYDIIKTAWDKNEIMSLVPAVELKGNLKVNFEISGDDAEWHEEGGDPVNEEELVEGIATLVAKNAKKWISISDEAMAYRGESFVRYIYDELAYRLVKLEADTLVKEIADLPTTANATTPSAPAVEAEPAMGTVAEAIAHLSDEATTPVIVMNKLTWSAFKKVQYDNNYAVDPFEGLPVHFSNKLPSFASADEGEAYMIVGDFRQGALANFPEGRGIKFVFDELTRKKEDLIEILGREFVAIGIVADKAFVNVVKPISESE